MVLFPTVLYCEFGKLIENKFIKNEVSFNLNNLQQTYNVVNYIYDQAELEIPKIDTSIMLSNCNEITYLFGNDFYHIDT